MSFWEIAAYLLALFIAIIILRIFVKPLKGILWLCINSVLGGFLLFAFNTVFASAGFSVAINVVTASICGLLGIPGLLLIIILKFIFHV